MPLYLAFEQETSVGNRSSGVFPSEGTPSQKSGENIVKVLSYNLNIYDISFDGLLHDRKCLSGL